MLTVNGLYTSAPGQYNWITMKLSLLLLAGAFLLTNVLRAAAF
jgi:hypothetical protein